MKIALAQMNATVGDIQGNVKKATDMYLQAVDAGCHLVVFPELTLTGYPPEDLLLRHDFLMATAGGLELFAKITGSCVAIIGLPVTSDNGVPYNAAAVCRDGKVFDYYHKQQLPNYAVFDEARYFRTGIGYQELHEIDGLKVGISICEDVWTEEVPCSQLELGADILVNLSASPYSSSRIEDREVLLSNLARKCHLPIAYCNLVGGQDELVFDGGSMIMNHAGRVWARAKQFEEELLIFDTTAKVKSIQPAIAPKLDHLEEIYAALVLGTRDYVQKVGCSKVLLGLSGGIDSALVAKIAADALGPANVTGVLMPSKYSSDGSIWDSLNLAGNIGINAIRVPIARLHAKAAEMFSLAYEELGETRMTNADENVQARLRGLILMALSNQTGALVLTTGNKSEMAMGYATLYGDMAGGFAVIKDVPKTLVFALCRWLNKETDCDVPVEDQCGWTTNGPGQYTACTVDMRKPGSGSHSHNIRKIVIPQEILDKPPSAELRPDQKDSDTLPDYDVLDQIIHRYVNLDQAPMAIWAQMNPSEPATGPSSELVRSVCRTIDRNEYKRRQAPPGIRISTKAFGRDRRLPISNRFTL